MSVIAWDGISMSADNQITIGTRPSKTTKLFKVTHKGLIYGLGFVGDPVEGLKLIDWWKYRKIQFPVYEDTELVVASYCSCYTFTASDIPIAVEEPFYATGSGMDFANSLLSLGGSTKDAVKHAIKNDIYCGLGVKTITF